MYETLFFLILCQPSTHWTGSRHHHGKCGCSDCLCYRHLCSPASLLPPVLVIRLPMDDGDVNTTHWLLHRGGCSKISCCSTIHESVLPSNLYWQGSSQIQFGQTPWSHVPSSTPFILRTMPVLDNTMVYHARNFLLMPYQRRFFGVRASPPSTPLLLFFFLTGRFSDIVPGYFFEALRWVPWSFMGCFLLGSSSFC